MPSTCEYSITLYRHVPVKKLTMTPITMVTPEPASLNHKNDKVYKCWTPELQCDTIK